MSVGTRFQCPSASLTLKLLLKRTQNTLWIGLALAIAAHGALTQLSGLAEEQKVAKPLTTQFVKRQPRLTKPLELKKRPRPRQRAMHRRMVSVQARIDRQQAASTIRPLVMVRSLARPHVAVMRSTLFSGTALEPKALAQAIESTKEVANQVDMSLEMVDIDALDTGQYQAMVIQDPSDKNNVRGYFHLYPVYIPSAAHAEARSTYGFGSYFAFPRAYQHLAEAMNRYTGIRTDIGKAFPLDSDEVFKTPIIFLSLHVSFQVSPADAVNAGQYLLAGGFIYTDTLNAGGEAVYHNMRDMFRRSLETAGKRQSVHWDFEQLPNSHAIYHCFFDFDGPPSGWDDFYPYRAHITPYMDGITIDGRLVGISTRKNYWACWWHDGSSFDVSRIQQFGVNIILFALVQEGSVTNRVMDSVRY